MTSKRACTSLKHSRIKQKLQTLYDRGLGYIKLGQPATTLSGGEAQRVNWPPNSAGGAPARHSTFSMSHDRLHFDDIKKLLAVLGRSPTPGIRARHRAQLDVIKTATTSSIWARGGDEGGYVVAGNA